METIEESSELKKLSFELDFVMGEMGDRVSTLADAEVLLGQLIGDMDTAAHRGQESLYYAEHQRELRVLGELIRYSLEDLSKDYQKAEKIKKQIFQLGHNKESHSDGNTIAFA